MLRLKHPAGLLSTLFLMAGGAPCDLWAADMLQPTGPTLVRPLAHEPKNITLGQFNHDGTTIFWTNTSKTRTVYFMSHSEMDAQPNGCPVCATWEIELRAWHVGDTPHFKFQPTMTVNGGCSASGDPTPSFDIGTGFLNLDPDTYYAWQARIAVNYEWLNLSGDGAHCEIRNTIFRSDWQQIGIPTYGYISFKTP
ncbi:hypothetical protein [Mesorhizobium huakuii]|uniref:Secreted protein n=1 Tax=Mesorhizobium huakuii TaxID=28104 RepID=A0ABZ0VVS8_9HYPH|nr:hypothetical protein [Mesorhizobium huakuii]WQC01119.1 hypothetical protein U0R22_005333 [Mesorhizobium huakuii]